jgi:hypothetical protein
MSRFAQPEPELPAEEPHREWSQAYPQRSVASFSRVPTHAIGVVSERRRSPRAALQLPLRLTQIGQQREPIPITLVTRNISSSGVCFLAPRRIEPGARVELEVALVERPIGRGGVRMSTVAHVVRVDACHEPGWHAICVTFDDFGFQRDEEIPARIA